MQDIPHYWRLSAFYLFYFALLGTLVPYWALYLREQGFDAVQIGLLMALPQVTKLVAPLLWGWLADRTGRRLAVIRLGNFIAALIFCGVFYAENFWQMALLLTAFSFFWNAVLAQFEALTLEALGERSGRYGHVRLWGSVGFIAAVCIVGFALDYYPVVLVAWVMLACLWLIWLCTLLLPGDNAEVAVCQRQSLAGLLREPGVLAFFACALLMQLSHGPYYTFFTIYLDELGVSRLWTGGLWALGVLAEVGLFLVMHRLLHRFRLSTLLAASLLIAAVRWLLIGTLAESWLVLLVAQCLHAVTFGCFHAASIAWVHRRFSGGLAGQGQALYSSIGFGAGWALGASLSGLLWARIGNDTFLLAALVALVASAIAWQWLPAQDR